MNLQKFCVQLRFRCAIYNNLLFIGNKLANKYAKYLITLNPIVRVC